MITREEVKKISELSMLDLNDEQLDALTVEMKSIIAFADAINSVHAEDTHVDGMSGVVNAFREDVVIKSYPAEEILRNAGGGENGFFALPSRKL